MAEAAVAGGADVDVVVGGIVVVAAVVVVVVPTVDGRVDGNELWSVVEERPPTDVVGPSRTSTDGDAQPVSATHAAAREIIARVRAEVDAMTDCCRRVVMPPPSQ
jgi:hypothetical protein